ncbi:MAG: hypothetical protein HY208_08760 [Nitrospirae bacterium]|nr:hypothetical protein [Nitrospirota bacterium]
MCGRWKRHGSIAGLLAVLLLLGSSPGHAFDLRGFGDVTFTKSDDAGSADRHGSFTLGQLDLYVTQPITDRLDVLAELTIESETSGDFVADLERLQIGYRAWDWLVIRAGRFHNLLGYWNLTFHHGRQIQTTINRPSMLAFEDRGGFLPVHLVGIWLSGYVPAGPLLINYGLMAGNGPKIAGLTSLSGGELDPNNLSDNSGNKAVAFNLTLHPRGLHNGGLGICGNISRIEGFDNTPAAAKVANISQQILCGEAHYVTETIELLAEYYALFDQDELTGLGRFTNHTWYLQAAYTFADRYVPYLRYERTSVAEGDPYMTMLGVIDTARTILGFRFNLASASSVKAEARLIDHPAPAGLAEHAHEFAVQWAFWF